MKVRYQSENYDSDCTLFNDGEGEQIGFRVLFTGYDESLEKTVYLTFDGHRYVEVP